MNQTFEAIEVLAVNDGSTDDTQAKLEQLTEKYPSLVIINQQNQGVSAARNSGIDRARGKYIGFVDADDYVEPAFVDVLVQPFLERHVDWTIAGAHQFLQNEEDEKVVRRSFTNEFIPALDKNEHFELRFISGEFDFANWNKLFKAEIIRGYNIQFESSLSIGEDLVFNLEYLSHADSVMLLNSSVYNYRIHDASLFHSSLKKQWVAYCQRTHLIETKCASQRIKISGAAQHKLISEQTVFAAIPMLLRPQLDRLNWTQFQESLSLASLHWFQPFDVKTSPFLRLQLFLLRNRLWLPLYLKWRATNRSI